MTRRVNSLLIANCLWLLPGSVAASTGTIDSAPLPVAERAAPRSTTSSTTRCRGCAIVPTAAASPVGALSASRSTVVHVKCVAEQGDSVPPAADSGQSAESWYALALAKLGESRAIQASGMELGLRDGMPQLEDAIAALHHALKLAPAFAAAAVQLAAAANESADSMAMRSALTTLRQSDSALHGANACVALWRGRLEREYGDYRSALDAFRRASETGATRALAGLESARTLLSAGDSGGIALYFLSAASADSAVIAGLRADLALIAPDSVVDRFESLSPPVRAAFLKRFWTARDYMELRAPGSRLMEHYRRLYYVRRHFRLHVTERAYAPGDVYRGPATGFDDRGIIYLRYGTPDLWLDPQIIDAFPNETWVYRRPQGDLVFNFTSGGQTPRPSIGDRFSYGGDISDYHLVPSVLDLHGAEQAPADLLLLSRDSVSPIYGHMLNWDRMGRAQARREERRLGLASIAIGTTTDSYVLRFRSPLNAFANVIAFGTDPRGAQVQLALAVAAKDITAPSPAPLRVRINLSRGGQLGAALDTTVLVSVPTSPDAWLLLHFAMGSMPGSWIAHLAISSADSVGVLLPDRQVEVPETDGSVLALSGIALGNPGSGLTWRPSPTEPIALSPSDAFARSEPLQVAYEAYGTRSGLRYRTTLRLQRITGGRRPKAAESLSLNFIDIARGPTHRAIRTIDAGRLPAGSYRVDIEIVGPDGAQATRSRILTLY